MSVIPFIISGNNRTIVETRQEYEKAGGLDGTTIFIQHLDVSQISSKDSSNVSYDLRVGSEYRDHTDSAKTDLADGQTIKLHPGAAVIIETAESVQFPLSRFGHIVPKVSLLQHGLSNTSSKIDPGYEGKLLITVFNLGRREISLTKGQKYCTLYILDVSNKEEVVPYKKGAQRIAGNVKSNSLRKLLDFIELKHAYFTVLLTIVTIILTVFQIAEHFQGEEERLPSTNIQKNTN